MRNIFILLIGVLFAVASCSEGNQQKKEGLVLEVEISGIGDGASVYLQEMGKGNRMIALDTAQLKEGKTVLDLPKVDSQTLNVITVDGVNGNLLLVNENTSLNIVMDPENLRNSKVEGGKGNDLLNDYLDLLTEGNKKLMNLTDNVDQQQFQDPEFQMQLRSLQSKLEGEYNQFRLEKIKENPKEIASVLMLNDLLRTQAVPAPQLKELYAGLSTDLKENYIGKEIGKELERMGNTVEVGDIAPSFSAFTPEGDELALEDALGKYTLVDFWAAWCMPCRKENPNIVNVYEKYHDRGFNVLGVSLDKDKDKWIKAIEDDNLNWPQISNLKFWQDPIAKQYSIRAIPASYILDENGKVVAKNVRGPALESKVKELLGE